MGLFDWLRKKKGPEQVGTSKGGSPIYNYEDNDPANIRMGIFEEPSGEEMEERERIYDEMFGESDSVYHEMIPLVPHVDVYRYPPNEKRDFYTFVTGGMSDLAMNVSPELGPEFRRTELVFYADQDLPEYADFLAFLAHFPHDNNTWLHWGTRCPMAIRQNHWLKRATSTPSFLCPRY
jgi:hypothetical protein